METRRLEYFVRIVDAGSISRAAQDLGLAQPALSQQLAILEQDLKVRLLHRSRQGVAPTAAGRQFYRQARVILRQVADARTLVRTAAESLAGSVSVGFPNSAGAVLCIPLIKTLGAAHPQIDLHITEGYSGMLTEMTRKGQLDVAVLYLAEAPDGVTVEPLWIEELLLVCPPTTSHGDTVPLEIVAEVPMMVPSQANSARVALDAALAQRNIAANIALQADSIVTLRKAVQQGIGYTLLPWPAVAEEVEKGLLRVAAFADGALKRTVSLCAPGAILPTPAQAKVQEIIRTLAREALDNGRHRGMEAARAGR